MTPRRRKEHVGAEAGRTSYVGMYAPEILRRKLRVLLLEEGKPMRQQLQEWITEYLNAPPRTYPTGIRLRGFTKDAVQVGVPLPEDLARKFRAKLIMEGLTASEWVTRRIAEKLGEPLEKILPEALPKEREGAN
ncbi:MAG: hypothetical protein QN198_09830 [Armatimonadota bacterium]|nr:hypothetical protein [Armatimonadota bacterium]MDR5703883.1 hypothetical protein [Armatimonadota bacterium]MDR7435799.1 hypothetical protein [Armatimonadota bacterium]